MKIAEKFETEARLEQQMGRLLVLLGELPAAQERRDSQGGPIAEMMYGLDLDPNGAHFLVSAWSFQFRSHYPPTSIA